MIFLERQSGTPESDGFVLSAVLTSLQYNQSRPNHFIRNWYTKDDNDWSGVKVSQTNCYWICYCDTYKWGQVILQPDPSTAGEGVVLSAFGSGHTISVENIQCNDYEPLEVTKDWEDESVYVAFGNSFDNYLKRLSSIETAWIKGVPVIALQGSMAGTGLNEGEGIDFRDLKSQYIDNFGNIIECIFKSDKSGPDGVFEGPYVYSATECL